MQTFYKLIVSFGVFGLVLLPAVSLAQVYISAVQTSGGTGHTTNDFIELFNPGSATVNLKGYSLVKRTATGASDSSIKSWSSDSFIAPDSFYLWANSGFTTISPSADITTSGSISDDNGVALRAGALDTGQIVDSLSWGQANNGFSNVSANIPAGSVLQRTDLFGAASSYNVVPAGLPRNSTVQVLPPVETPPATEPVVVVPADEPTGSVPDQNPDQNPVSLPAAPVYLPLVIDEVLPNPVGADDGNETIEIYNPNNAAVDLAGWFLDDGLAAAPTSSAYELSGLINPGEYKISVTPAGKFALNNTGGDSVELFSPDKKVVDSVTYTGTAQENMSYQKFGSNWQWGDPSLGLANVLPQSYEGSTTSSSDGSLSTSTKSKITYTGITLNEFYPAQGDDGPMWVELANNTASDVDLGEWQLDISTTHLKKPSDSADVIAGPRIVRAGGSAKIELKNILNSDLDEAGKYWVILYSPDDKSQDAVNVKTLVEKLSYAKFGSLGWLWSDPSPEMQNKVFAEPNLRLSEIVPSYKDAESDSYMEVRNQGSAPVYLGNLKVKIGAKADWLPGYTLQPGEYYAVYAESLPASLPTKGQEVSITDANGKVVTGVAYPKAPTGLAYMLGENEKWVWTQNTTPNAANIFEAPNPDAGISATEKSLKAKVATLNNTIALLWKPKPVAKSVAKLPTLPPKNSNGAALPAEDPEEKPNRKPAWVLGIVAALVLGASVIIWFVSKEPEIS